MMAVYLHRVGKYWSMLYSKSLLHLIFLIPVTELQHIFSGISFSWFPKAQNIFSTWNIFDVWNIKFFSLYRLLKKICIIILNFELLFPHICSWGQLTILRIDSVTESVVEYFGTPAHKHYKTQKYFYKNCVLMVSSLVIM